MPHFFIKSGQVNNDKISISDKENYFHIARSLRARKGEKLLLIDENKIQYETTIESITNSEITAKVDNSYPSKRFLDFELYLAQSPLRSAAQNLLIEKATELGVKGVYPVKTDNCALNNEMIDKKNEKWQKIMYESSKQCERADIPTCYPRTTIEKILSENNFDKVIVFCERIATKTIKESFNQKPVKKGDKVLVIIGPEGGFSQKEFEWFESKAISLCERAEFQLEQDAKVRNSGEGSNSKQGEILKQVQDDEELRLRYSFVNSGERIEMLTLGDMILRAETATTVALGNIIYEYSNH